MQVAFVLARVLRQPRSRTPSLTVVQRRHLEVAAGLLEADGRLEAAGIVATAAKAAVEDLRQPRVQWDDESARLAAALGDPGQDLPGAVGNNQPEQSWSAALLVMPRSGTQRRTILDMVYNDELSGRYEGLTPNEAGMVISPRRLGTANTRMGELRGEGKQGRKCGPWLHLRGDMRSTTGAHMAAVHELSMFARQRLGLLQGPPSTQLFE